MMTHDNFHHRKEDVENVRSRSSSTPASSADGFLSPEACRALTQYATRIAVGGGDTDLVIASRMHGYVRWGRNRLHGSGEIQWNSIRVTRKIRGAVGSVVTNQVHDVAVEATVRRAERLVKLTDEIPGSTALPGAPDELCQTPPLWFDRTAQLNAAARIAHVRDLVTMADNAGLLSAGFLQVTAAGAAAMNARSRSLYMPATYAQLSMTVRDPAGTASGWAGIDWNDWGRIDAATLAKTAIEKCLSSRNPTAIEPGRYLTILEPQAVCDFVTPLLNSFAMRRSWSEQPMGPFGGTRRGENKIGERLLDPRITIGADPMDPDLSFIPFEGNDRSLDVYHPATWFTNGVLTSLAYDRRYGIEVLNEDAGLPNSGAFRMSGGATTIPDMISATRRGLLVTRFSNVTVLDSNAMLCSGYTRDGVWLIENGQVKSPIKNMKFAEGVLLSLNRVVHLGTPTRVFHPRAPVIVPPLQIADFSFTALSGAI